MHVHTIHSGMCTVPLFNRICRESYSDPLAVYTALKERGMNLITVTDHDSIDAAESLRTYSDFFLSEEVSCLTPSGARLHLSVYGIHDRHHLEICRRRDDLLSLIAYLNEQRIFFSINHVFSGLTGPRTHADFALFEQFFPAIETRNGQMLASCNRSATALAERWQKSPVAGSDAHTLSSLGFTYTEVPGARNSWEFLEGLRHGQARIHGASGDYWKLTRTLCEIGTSMMREKTWTLLFSPLLLAVPLAAAVNFLREQCFSRSWDRRLKRRQYTTVNPPSPCVNTAAKLAAGTSAERF